MSDALRVLLGRARSGRPAPAGPLRIAMMIETLGLGGAEVVVIQLAEELRRRGHTVFPVGPAGREGWMKNRVIELGFEWHTYDLQKPIDWSCAVKLGELLRRLGVHLAHSHEFTASIYGTAGCRLAGIPHVITMHGNQVMTRKLQRRVALRWAFRKSEATVAVSGDTRQHLLTTLGLPAGAIGTVRNGIPDRPGNAAAVRAELGLQPGELLVIAVGSLMERKGHRILLEAMRLVDQEGGVPPWRIAIAGEGVERGNLESFIATHGLGARARLLGNRDDIPDIQAAADVFTMPSLWEGLPLAVLEAMFAANPIIATSASGIPEALADGSEGLLIPPADPAALAGALHRLLTDPAERERLGAAARRRAQRDFSITAMADAYEGLYRGQPVTA